MALQTKLLWPVGITSNPPAGSDQDTFLEPDKYKNGCHRGVFMTELVDKKNTKTKRVVLS